MTSAELDLRTEASPLIDRMTATVVLLAQMDANEVAEARRDAAIVEAAANRADAHDVEVAAARLRLHAERRLGQLAYHYSLDQFSASQLTDFRRLADIPIQWRNVALSKLSESDVYEDLFHKSVESSLDGRSHTPYSVYRISIELSSVQNSSHSWLYKSWDGTWTFYYKDAKTNRRRKASITGDIRNALEYRAVLSGKARAAGAALLPIRGARQPDLGNVLDSVREAREGLGNQWPSLNRYQQDALDGAYSHLDDLATAIVKALNL